MKTRIQIALIRFSTKNSTLIIPISLIILFVAKNTKIPYNNFELIGMIGIMLLLITTRWFSGLPDYTYNSAARRKLDDLEQRNNRLKCASFSLLIASIFILTFSSMSVGHPMTYPSAVIKINGHKLSGFHFVDILRSNTFK